MAFYPDGDIADSDAPFLVGPAAESSAEAPRVAPADGGSADDLTDRLRRREQELRRLLLITGRISYGVTLDETLDFVYREMHPVIPYNRIGFSLIDGGSVIARWARSDRPMLLTTGYQAPLAGSSLQQILSTRRPRVINDLAAYLREKPQSQSTRLIVEEGMRSSLTCPLIVQGKPVGFMFFSSAEKGAYSHVHVGVFQQVAGLLSGIVEQGRLYSELADQKTVIERQNRELTEELDMARRVQRSLIPSGAPAVGGLRIAWAYEPASQVGGDLLDIIPLDDERVLLFVGDAMGHGVPAALVMAVAKTALQSAVMTDAQPAPVLAHVNEVICRLNIEQFVTAACCLIDVGNQRAILALAGHPWPCCFRAKGGGVEPLGKTGMPLGLEPRSEYEVTTTELDVGDVLVFYTDGVIEAFGPQKNPYGIDRLTEQIRKHGRRDVPDILKAIEEDLSTYCCATCPADDVALLAVKVTGSGV